MMSRRALVISFCCCRWNFRLKMRPGPSNANFLSVWPSVGRGRSPGPQEPETYPWTGGSHPAPGVEQPTESPHCKTLGNNHPPPLWPPASPPSSRSPVGAAGDSQRDGPDLLRPARPAGPVYELLRGTQQRVQGQLVLPRPHLRLPPPPPSTPPTLCPALYPAIPSPPQAPTGPDPQTLSHVPLVLLA